MKRVCGIIQMLERQVHRMRILSITAQKPHSTGSGTYLTELVRSWDRAGHEQAVVYGIFPDDKVSFPDGVSCYPVHFSYRTKSSESADLSAPVIPFPVVGMSDIMPYESTLYRDLTPEMISEFEDVFISVIGQAVNELDPDLIVCHHLFLLTALVRKHFPDRRIFGISHGTDLRQMVNCEDLRPIVKPYIRELDMLLALHDDQKKTIAEIFDVSDERIMVIGSGYNARLFNAVNRAPRRNMKALIERELAAEGADKTAELPVMICYAGKLSRPKGVPELIIVLRRLAEDPEVPSFEVTLAGGCQDEYVQAMLDELPENIRWIGQVPQERLADIFRYSDIFVLPSYFEGLPLVLIEAMASGMIPVCTDLPGVRPWLEANVPDHNAVFIPIPEMKTIDAPTEKGRAEFTDDLFAALKSLIIDVDKSEEFRLPDTSRITWDAAAGRLLTFASM